MDRKGRRERMGRYITSTGEKTVKPKINKPFFADDKHLTPVGIWLKGTLIMIGKSWSKLYAKITGRTAPPSSTGEGAREADRAANLGAGLARDVETGDLTYYRHPR